MTPRFGPFPEPESFPGVVECRGGWFAVWKPGEKGSGPWRTQAAAEHALAGRYLEAHAADRQ